MPKGAVKLKGICDDFRTLTGIGFRFISVSSNGRLFSCAEKDFCHSKNFDKQCESCRRIQKNVIKKALDCKGFVSCTFQCGLSELILPVVSNGRLWGLILSDRINAGGRSNGNMKKSVVRMDSKKLASLTAVLNACRFSFKESIPSSPGSYKKSKDQIYIGKAKQYIEENYHQLRLTLKDLAGEVGTNYYHLSRLFKDHLNMNFVKYLTLVRLRTALQLLNNRQLNVAQVAYAVGYSDAQYFDRVFKKYVKCRPRDYIAATDSKREKIRQRMLICF